MCDLTIKRVGLMSSLLALVHGLYFPFYFLWLFLAPIGILNLPAVPSLLYPILDTVLYLILGLGMLRGKNGYFVYSIVWSVWSALLTTLAAPYGNASYALNLLSFLIVFCSTYYYIDANKADPVVSKALGAIAGLLALVQGIIIAIILVALFAGLSVVTDISPVNFILILSLSLATGAVYLILGIGMIGKLSGFFEVAIFWTIIEAAFAAAYLPVTQTHINVISVLITAFATYSYFARKQQ